MLNKSNKYIFEEKKNMIWRIVLHKSYNYIFEKKEKMM